MRDAQGRELILTPTSMRLAFEDAGYYPLGKSGMRRVPAWTVSRRAK